MGVTAFRRHNAELLQEEGRNTGPDKNSVEIPDSLKLQDFSEMGQEQGKNGGCGCQGCKKLRRVGFEGTMTH